MKKILAANLKMYLNFEQEVSLFKKVLDFFNKNKNLDANNFIYCPSFVSLETIKQLKSSISVGAQNCASQENGALTGEVPSSSLKEVGCTYCIVGHSERRYNFDENISEINKKVELLLANNITPVVCIGENLEEKKLGKTEFVIDSQIKEIKKLESCIIAYEPIWAIGNDKIAKNSDIEKVINLIKSDLNCKVLYGGSVNSENILKLSAIKNLDGFLVGRSSTNFQELKKMLELLK